MDLAAVRELIFQISRTHELQSTILKNTKKMNPKLLTHVLITSKN